MKFVNGTKYIVSFILGERQRERVTSEGATTVRAASSIYRVWRYEKYETTTETETVGEWVQVQKGVRSFSNGVRFYLRWCEVGGRLVGCAETRYHLLQQGSLRKERALGQTSKDLVVASQHHEQQQCGKRQTGCDAREMDPRGSSRRHTSKGEKGEWGEDTARWTWL